MQIEWKDIVGFEGFYKVNDIGQVKSLHSNKLLKQNITGSGYKYVNLYRFGSQKHKDVHVLMAESFLGHTSNGYEIVVDHIDNNKLNNVLKNLQLISNRKNSMKDKNPRSGHSCIYKNSGNWLVRMRVKGKKISVGTFKKIDDAIVARDKYIEALEIGR